MSSVRQPPDGSAASPQGADEIRLCVLLACFDGAKSASAARSVLDQGFRKRHEAVLDEVVIRVNGKRKALVYDPRRTWAGALTPALTWGVFGLVASGGSWTSFLLWAVIGAVSGGLYAYYTEHLLTKSQLQRIGGLMGADTSALAYWIETGDAQDALASTSRFSPTMASAAIVRDDLSAQVLTGATNPTPNSSASSLPSETAADARPASGLNMLLFRYRGMGTGEEVNKAASSAARAPQVELIVEADSSGKRRVVSPKTGVRAMATNDVISWGLFGVVYGAVIGFVAAGGVLSSIENGIVTGILWAIFGLVAGAIYGLFAGRSASGHRLNPVGRLIPPDSSIIVAWADGADTEQTIAALSRPGVETLDLRFNPTGHGAILEV